MSLQDQPPREAGRRSATATYSPVDALEGFLCLVPHVLVRVVEEFRYRPSSCCNLHLPECLNSECADCWIIEQTQQYVGHPAIFSLRQGKDDLCSRMAQLPVEGQFDKFIGGRWISKYAQPVSNNSPEMFTGWL